MLYRTLPNSRVATNRIERCERNKESEWKRDGASGETGWICRISQRLAEGWGSFTLTRWLLTLAHGVGTVLQHITISIWRCLHCPHAYTYKYCVQTTPCPYKPTTGTMGLVYWLLAKPMPGRVPSQHRAKLRVVTATDIQLQKMPSWYSHKQM